MHTMVQPPFPQDLCKIKPDKSPGEEEGGRCKVQPLAEDWHLMASGRRVCKGVSQH